MPQAGHWKSAHSSIVIGALSEPRTWLACRTPGTMVGDGGDDAPPLSAMKARTPTTAANPAIASCRPDGRTGSARAPPRRMR
jgi:hypothetical protein